MSIEKIIAVGSGTGLKPDCVREVFTEYKIVAVAVESGVSDQPIGFKEIRQGAVNRSLMAVEKAPEAMFWFGIENGLVQIDNDVWADIACIICMYPDATTDILVTLEKWTHFVNVPNEWAQLALENRPVTYTKLVQEKFPELKDLDLKDPHTYLTHGKKSRKLIICQALESIKKSIDRYLMQIC